MLKRNSGRVSSARSIKTWFVLAYDCFAIIVSWVLAYIVRFNFSFHQAALFEKGMTYLPLVLVVQVFLYWYFKAHRSIWKFASLLDLIKLVKAALVGTVGLAFILFITVGQPMPRSIFVIYPLLLLAFWSAGRFAVRYRAELKARRKNLTRVLIVGAGHAGEMFVRDILRAHSRKYEPVAFLDDNKALHGKEIHGVRVLGATDDAATLIADKQVELIVVAMPSASSHVTKPLLNTLQDLGVPISIVPSLEEIASGHAQISDLREVAIEDLLGRDPVTLDWEPVKNEISGQVVLVTGGGGSIGSELCRQICRFKPKKLIVLDHAEFNLYQIGRELLQTFPEVDVQLTLASVTDESVLTSVFANHHPDLVYHAAAYKHVPMLEAQVQQAIQNNLLGTKTVAEISVKYAVKKFVMVSTDKAVNPTNVMGATKRAAEIFCQSYDNQVETNFVTVRFGNVLGSAGSVVPLFKQQILAGGPVTVTHPDMTRYFMTIPEASQLVLQAGALGEGGEIFVLDMGEPVKIVDLAEKMIRLSGKKVEEDIHISFTGLRPGEKMFEELFYQGEPLQQTKVQKVMAAKHEENTLTDVLQKIAALHKTFDQAQDMQIQYLKQLVVTFK